jgi:hypothetical protein
MGKKKKANTLEKAEQRLAEAQLELHVAQEKRAQAITRGEHEIERVRQRAAARETKATTRVEKRAAAVARAESAIATLTKKKVTPRQTHAEAPAVAIGAPETPQAAADILEREAPQPQNGPIVVPESVEIITGGEIEGPGPDSSNASGPTW